MNSLPYRVYDFQDDDPLVDRSFGLRQTHSRLQYEGMQKNEGLITTNVNVNILGNHFRLKPVIYDMEESVALNQTSHINNVHKQKIMATQQQQQQHQQQQIIQQQQQAQNEKFDLGTLVLGKIIEQMKSLNTSVNTGSVIYDNNVSKRAGLPLYTAFLDETNTKQKRHRKDSIYGNNIERKKAVRDKKTRYAIPKYFT